MKLPPGIFAQHIAVLGKTGSGKTSTAKLIVEAVVKQDDARVCILDPIKSDWWGLTRLADGKRPGLPFCILGGPYGHVPLHSAAGEAIGRVVAGGALRHSVIDMADFMPGEHARFFIAFAHALFRHMKGVVYLVVEEAQIFAPKEKPGFGEEAKSTHWMTRLATGARSKGIRLSVCTSRVQALHNAVLGSCETLIAHRLTLPADQEPVKKWLAGNTDKPTAERITASLSSLKAGEGWLCSGEAQIIERGQLPRIATYDNSATPTGKISKKEVRPAAVDVEALAGIIGDAAREAQANDPAELKRQLAQARQTIKTLEAHESKVTKIEIKEIEVPVLKNGQLARTEKLADRLQEHANKFLGEMNELRRLIAPAAGARPSASRAPAALVSTPPRPIGEESSRIQRTTSPLVHAGPAGNGVLGRGETQVLIAIAQHPGGVTREQLSVLAGYRRSSRDTYLQRLRAAGYVRHDGERITATAAGAAALGAAYEPLPVGAALREYWMNRLRGGELRIFAAICEAGSNPVDREALTESTDYRRSSRDTFIQRLRARQLIVVNAAGFIAPAKELFD